jgi:hypothetical protein
MAKSVIGIVASRTLAEAVTTTLQTKGFASDKSSAPVPDDRGPSAFVYEHRTKAPEGVVAGATGGGVSWAERSRSSQPLARSRLPRQAPS